MRNFEDNKEKKAAWLPPPTALDKLLNPNNTSAFNQRGIVLQALLQGPKTTIELRYQWGIMHPAARIQELRGQGHLIHTIRTNSPTPDGIKHNAVAKYIYGGKHNE